MAVPTSISELSTTPGSNPPAGSDAPSVLDDHARTAYAFIKTLSDEKSAIADTVLLTGNQTVAGTKTFSSNIVGNLTGNASGTAANVTGTVAIANGGTGQTTAAGIQSILPVQQTRVDVASASTVNLTSSVPSNDHIQITGTTTITGFTVASGRLLFVRFGGSLVLTSGAAITTQTGANITTQNGDTCILRAINTDTVEILSYREGRWGSHAGSAPLYACRAWVNFNGTGTVAIRSSQNVSSITDNGVGDYTVNFSIAMPDASYAVITGGRSTSPAYSSIQTNAATAIAAGSCRISSVVQDAGVPAVSDCEAVSVAIFR